MKVLQFGDGWISVGCHVNVSLILRATVCVVEVGLGMRLHVNVGGSSPHPVELFRCKCCLSKKRHAWPGCSAGTKGAGVPFNGQMRSMCHNNYILL